MLPSTSVKVRVETKAGKQLGVTMNDIRSWLDNHKIQPAEFRAVPTEQSFGFELTFHNEDHAKLFRQHFGVV